MSFSADGEMLGDGSCSGLIADVLVARSDECLLVNDMQQLGGCGGVGIHSQEGHSRRVLSSLSRFQEDLR